MMSGLTTRGKGSISVSVLHTLVRGASFSADKKREGGDFRRTPMREEAGEQRGKGSCRTQGGGKKEEAESMVLRGSGRKAKGKRRCWGKAELIRSKVWRAH